MAGLGAAMPTGEVQPATASRSSVAVGSASPRNSHHRRKHTSDPVAEIQQLTDGNGADVCIEAVGHRKVFEQAFYVRDLAGTVVQVGVPTPDIRIDIPMIDFFGRGGQLRPSSYGDCLRERDFPLVIELYLQGRLDLNAFVSEVIALEDVEAAFAKMRGGDVLRSVVALGAAPKPRRD